MINLHILLVFVVRAVNGSLLAGAIVDLHLEDVYVLSIWHCLVTLLGLFLDLALALLDVFHVVHACLIGKLFMLPRPVTAHAQIIILSQDLGRLFPNKLFEQVAPDPARVLLETQIVLVALLVRSRLRVRLSLSLQPRIKAEVVGWNRQNFFLFILLHLPEELFLMVKTVYVDTIIFRWFLACVGGNWDLLEWVGNANSQFAVFVLLVDLLHLVDVHEAIVDGLL